MSGAYVLAVMLALTNLISCKWSSATSRQPFTFYTIQLGSLGTEYRYFISFSTVTDGKSNCGGITGPNLASLISGYDATLIQFTDRTVIPKRADITMVIIGANQGPGTVPARMTAEITEHEGKLVLNIW